MNLRLIRQTSMAHQSSWLVSLDDREEPATIRNRRVSHKRTRLGGDGVLAPQLKIEHSSIDQKVAFILCFES
jgi:hypothetical protein